MSVLAMLVAVVVAAPLGTALAAAVHASEHMPPPAPPAVARAVPAADEGDGLCESCRLRPATVLQVAAGETFAVCRGCAVQEVQS